uniref:Uncharacterized protein n=1 Tax=Tanacetum cinerariifolium TaxID=118510 RepID=A0A6L2MAU6_TANCI|nr:hypothetical protein [Tanacetum cinerariifolium]
MSFIEELANAAKSNKIKYEMLVLLGRQVETELKLEEKFRELCNEVPTVVKEKKDVVEDLERLSDNHVAKETVCLGRRKNNICSLEMSCIEELANAAKSNKIKDEMLVLLGRQVETELKLKEKFRELCNEVPTVVKEKKDVVEDLERLSDNHVAKETVCLGRGKKYDLDKMTHL